jgi:hypothetical protein
MTVSPTVFFFQRVSEGFSGKRDLYITEDETEIINRLKIILRRPLEYRGYCPSLMMFLGHGGTTDLNRFEILPKHHILLRNNEFQISKMAVYRPSAHWQYFIYLENAPDKPIGLSESSLLREEYAISNGEFITREEYDDGSIYRNGISRSIGNVELRVRHLVPTNLIISSRSSPINDKEFDRTRCAILNGILSGKKDLRDFIDELDLYNGYNNSKYI